MPLSHEFDDALGILQINACHESEIMKNPIRARSTEYLGDLLSVNPGIPPSSTLEMLRGVEHHGGF